MEALPGFSAGRTGIVRDQHWLPKERESICIGRYQLREAVEKPLARPFKDSVEAGRLMSNPMFQAAVRLAYWVAHTSRS